MCLEWQLKEVEQNLDATGRAESKDDNADRVSLIKQLASTKPSPTDTFLLYQRDGADRELRRKAARGELTAHDISQFPEPFRPLLGNLTSPISPTTGKPVCASDYSSMIGEEGFPRLFDSDIMR